MTRAPSSQEQYPRFVTLCGRVFHDTDPAYFPRLAHRGRTIYLCTQSCRDAFRADPDAFYKAHRDSEKGREHVESRR